MPFFMIGYIAVCFYIIGLNYHALPDVIAEIFRGAFQGHAPIGGFVGSTMLMAAYQGTSRAVYAGDIGVGFDSCVQSETMISDPKKQAQIAIYALFTDTFICMMTTLLLASTGAWYSMNSLPSDDVVSNILSLYLPYADMFMTILLFFAGFTTVIAYFAVGVKNAMFISPKYGKWTYIALGICAFAYFPIFLRMMFCT
jgi:AGCS family alanine or glycine:cation symporter